MTAGKREKKPWSGRFTASTDRLAEELNASIGFDRRLLRHDITGSKAHARTLEKAGILTPDETKRILRGLDEVEEEIASGRVELTAHMEDIHMAVERRLTEKIGALGGKLHTGRSRNDQVALDLRLYLRDEIGEIRRLIVSLQRVLVDLAGGHVETILPGYTHLQRAQPVVLAHHLLAYYEMFKRDDERMGDCLRRTDAMPLGSGALAGSPYRLDRAFTARLLGFSRLTENSIDGVSDRDFAVEFLAAAAILAMHLSRLSEELIVWSSQEFGFIELSDAFTTGSSIMPQKKNPDMAELARGKTGRVYGSLMALLTTMKGLPLAYNKDMQEDKEPLFDTVDTIKSLLRVFAPMMASMKVNDERMLRATAEGFLNATDAADYLVARGVPFRQAHEAAGRAVAWCMERGTTLDELTVEQWRRFSQAFGDDIREAVAIGRSVASRKVRGGTAPSEVRRRLRAVEKELGRREASL
ncbi:MAG TPA: argininosuccinate lyase [Deltaproteobacteria bacterium]|nr:argininosuccinate lyase [Deltaproteobacteria bacterium]